MRKIIFFLATIILLSCPVFANEKQDALKAYNAYMATQSSYSRFALGYLDKDSVPELFCGNKIYTFKKGKMASINYNFYAPYAYYKKKGIFISAFAHGNIYMAYSCDYYYRLLKSGKTEVLLTKDFSQLKGKKEEITYRKGSKKITKAKFTKLLKKYVGAGKKVKLKYYANDKANREKYLPAA